jgi:hypothetical protein
MQREDQFVIELIVEPLRSIPCSSHFLRELPLLLLSFFQFSARGGNNFSGFLCSIFSSALCRRRSSSRTLSIWSRSSLRSDVGSPALHMAQ